MKNQRKNYFIKPGFQTKLTLIILLIVVIVANIVGGIIYGLLSGSVVIKQLASIFEVENTSDLLLPVILFSELIAICIVTFIGVFVSHTMAGPVYRFERVLNDMAAGELDIHFHLRTSDEFQELAEGFNRLIATLNSKMSEMKVYASSINNVMADVSGPKDLTSYDIENIRETVNKLSASVNYFKMIDASDDEDGPATVQLADAAPASVASNAMASGEISALDAREAAERVSRDDLIRGESRRKPENRPETKSSGAHRPEKKSGHKPQRSGGGDAGNRKDRGHRGKNETRKG